MNKKPKKKKPKVVTDARVRRLEAKIEKLQARVSYLVQRIDEFRQDHYGWL